MRILKRYLPLILLVVFAVVLALAPAVQIFFQTKGAWRGVIPEYPKDALLYFARMMQVAHGYPFMGNPYIWEYRMAPALSFFVADWLTAVPLLLGISFTATVLFNIVFWSVLFCIICYLLFLKLELKPWQSVFAAGLSYTQVYWLMLRPVVMQTVFPAYLVFLLAYLLWFKFPASKKRIIFLAVASAIAFYIYTFLWQIVAVSFVFTYAYLIIKKRWEGVRSLIISNSVAAILAFPMLMYTIKQSASSFYWETLLRVNLVYTRLPTPEVYYYGRWVVLAIVLCLIFRFIDSKQMDSSKKRDLFVAVCITGLSLLAASVSNVVLNKEVDTASHIGRFTVLWFSVVFCALIPLFWSRLSKNNQISLPKKVIIGILLLGVSFGYIRNSFRATSFSNVVHLDVVSIQDYAGPLNWIDKNVSSEQVVWILNPKIDVYVPILTHNYTLFDLNADEYLMPSDEIIERYMVSHYFDNLSLADIKRDYSEYAGAGERAQYQAHNRWVSVCDMFLLQKLAYTCGNIETEISYKGEQYFSELQDRYMRQIVPNIRSELAKYHVSYILVDTKTDQFKKPLKSIGLLTLVYKDDTFEIYKIVPK